MADDSYEKIYDNKHDVVNEFIQKKQSTRISLEPTRGPIPWSRPSACVASASGVMSCSVLVEGGSGSGRNAEYVPFGVVVGMTSPGAVSSKSSRSISGILTNTLATIGIFGSKSK